MHAICKLIQAYKYSIINFKIINYNYLSTSLIMKAAIAFDVQGVLIKSGKSLPRAQLALSLLKQFKIPFVMLTNAGGRREQVRAKIFNQILETDLLTSKNVIQAHTPMKEIYHDINEERLVNGESSVTLIGGSDECHEICEDYGFKRFVTV